MVGQSSSVVLYSILLVISNSWSVPGSHFEKLSADMVEGKKKRCEATYFMLPLPLATFTLHLYRRHPGTSSRHIKA